MRLLPSITGNTIWAVLPQACQESSSSTCNSDRGGIFATNQSSTWEDKGRFQLPLNPEHYLPFSGGANLGFDNVTLGWEGSGGITLDHQVVAGYVTDDFYVGVLGLSPNPINITSFSDQYPSFTGALKAGNYIPSHSYAYTAGASYHRYPRNAFGSLTLGGYDSTRMDPTKNLTIVGGSDSYRPLLLGIEKITSGSVDLLDAPIITALNSIVTQIWLPISACQQFESAFGLVWNSTNELYLLNETQHSILVSQNASITFTLSTGSKVDQDTRLDISLPYAAFDLTAKSPYAGLNETVYYFPLKRAANDTQYTLGRTFLQETYMIADYERGALSLFPAVFPDSSAEPNLIPIISPERMYAPTVTQGNPQGILSRQSVIGIVVGCIVLMILVAAGAFLCILRNRHEKGKKGGLEVSSRWDKAELASSQTYARTELEGKVVGDPVHDVTSSTVGGELTHTQISHANRPVLQEMPGDHGGAELCPHRQVCELPGSSGTTKEDQLCALSRVEMAYLQGKGSSRE